MGISIINDHPKRRVPRRKVSALIEGMARFEKRKIKSLTFVFTTNPAIRKINKKFLLHDFATDTITFDLSDGLGIDGEIYISLDKAAEQAKTFGVSYEDEVLRLSAHGFLHLAGYDDKTFKARQAMLERGDRYMEKLL